MGVLVHHPYHRLAVAPPAAEATPHPLPVPFWSAISLPHLGWGLAPGSGAGSVVAVVRAGSVQGPGQAPVVILVSRFPATHVYTANGTGGFSPPPAEEAVVALDASRPKVAARAGIGSPMS